MYVESLNSRRKILNCPQITPAIVLSDKQIIGYNLIPVYRVFHDFRA
jgi:hypothetical protein